MLAFCPFLYLYDKQFFLSFYFLLPLGKKGIGGSESSVKEFFLFFFILKHWNPSNIAELVTPG